MMRYRAVYHRVSIYLQSRRVKPVVIGLRYHGKAHSRSA